MNKSFVWVACLFGLAAISCAPKANTMNQPTDESFHYLLDEFADLKIIRYKVLGWDALDLRQKSLVYYLAEAAKCGRDIYYDQNCRVNIPIRRCLENILESYTGDRTTEAFLQFTEYAKRVFFSNGIHHHYAEDKILPACSEAYIRELIEQSAESPYGTEWAAVMCDPNLYPMRKMSGGKGDLLLSSATNLYVDVSRPEAEAFYAALEDTTNTRPVELGLNSQLVKKEGRVVENTYKIGGMYGEVLEQVCYWLEKAATVAQSEAQAATIRTLISYYQTGDLALWDQFNMAWAQDVTCDVDFVNGFVEVYDDPLGRKGSWEANVNFRDREASKRTATISDNAQWFEDHSPIDPRFRKKEVKGVSAKVINVATLGGSAFPSTSIGINLPNSDWIRKEYGSKSVTIANITNAYDRAAEESPKNMLDAFSWDQAEIDLIKQYGGLTSDLHTDLHECLGHGSGQLLEGTSPSALKDYSSPLEEARADLFALYYLADPKLIELGILPNEEAYKAEYINYIRNGLFTQLVRIELGKSLTQAHMQCRQLIASWCYEKGLANQVIEQKVRDGKSYFVINDYAALRGLFGQLLAEMQRIKSEGDYAAGKQMVETYGIQINRQWHKEVKERYAALALKPYGGFVNPDITPVKDRKGNIVDYQIHYVADFLQQHLAYGRFYSFLP